MSGSGPVQELVSAGPSPAMREAWRVLRDARAAALSETGPERRAAICALVRDLEARIAPVSAEYARACLRLIGPDPAGLRRRTDPDGEARLSLIGLLLAEAGVRLDPAVHGVGPALREMRAVLAREAGSSGPTEKGSGTPPL